MKKFMDFIEAKFVPVAAKLGANRHLSALRDGFVATIAIQMAGALAVLINNLPIKSYQAFMLAIFGEKWKDVGGQIWWSAFGMSTIFVVISIAYALAKSYGEEGIAAPITALASFFALTSMTHNEQWGVVSWTFTNQNAIFTGLIVSLIATEIFVRLAKSPKLVIKMPEGVPPAVSRAFAKLLPGMITLVLFALVQVLLNNFVEKSFNQIVWDTVSAPLQGAANTMGAAMLIPFLNQFLWFFGLHGSNILTPIVAPVMGPLLETNMAIYQGLQEGTYAVFAGPFLDAFVYMGGSGTTVGLLIAILAVSKSKHKRDVAGLSFGPACFNINEPIIFGFPMVLNPMFAIPFIFTPVVLAGIAFLAISTGLVHPVVAASPWTTPAIIGGWVATGGRVSGALLAAFNLAVSVVIYAPFVIVSDRVEAKIVAESKTEASTI